MFQLTVPSRHGAQPQELKELSRIVSYVRAGFTRVGFAPPLQRKEVKTSPSVC